MSSKRIFQFVNQVSALWKLCLSFRKRDWTLNDYPVSVRMQELNPDYEPPRFKRHSYVASIVNWHLTGCGDTRYDAMHALNDTFRRLKYERLEKGTPLPRPGTRVPIEFAPNGQITAHGAVADDFIHRVLELEWAWISDDSSLWDFHTNQTNDLLYAKIRDAYSLDVSDIQNAKISEILDRIEEVQRTRIR